MQRQALICVLTLVAVAILDLLVTLVLITVREQGTAQSLVRYFDYGRSVPGKLAQWQETPGTAGNLFDVAWRSDVLTRSRTYLANDQDPGVPVIRAYGMSFVGNILRQAELLDSSLIVDFHTGPAAPPNFTYSVFVDDHANRKPGDVAVLGVLSSSVPALFALSNRTWVFEQPAPYTYPIFLPAETDMGLDRIDPQINSAAAERALRAEPDRAAAWERQIRTYDAFYSPITMGWAILDHSPFLRLVRRALATRLVEERKVKLVADEALYSEVLRRMAVQFGQTARSEGMLPIIFLIQSRNPQDANLRAVLVDTLQAYDIPYLATEDLFSPQDVRGFLGDGHYTPAVDTMFGSRFLEMIAHSR